ncbi:hypothetical protein PsorP6_018286 [Peronosclerospora sorghi]|nr:hypothetical protein PsorP6_018302 [Peronosclerospora sorghi]KAI9895382.1 hypothetical protein PsorP6_018286 [Peronosclerospora sorghi]
MTIESCSEINSERLQWAINAVCSLCISTENCGFNVVNLSCESENAATNGTPTTYCSSSDRKCLSCTPTSTNPICMGTDGKCICPSICSNLQLSGTGYTTNSQTSGTVYVGLAASVICMAFLVFVITKCKRRYFAFIRRRAVESQLRRETESLRIRQPQLALNLVGWRHSNEQDPPTVHKLGVCCYTKKTEETTQDAELPIDVGADDEVRTSMETCSGFSEIEFPRIGRVQE